jgi:hypothetical protein
LARSWLLVFFLVQVCAPILAADRGSYDALLVPVYDSGAGGFGSNWQSVLRIYNGADAPAAFGTHVYAPPCTISACSGPIPAHATVLFGYGPNQRQGFIIYPPKDLRGYLQYKLRIRDLSRETLTWGTEIPLVWESEFRETPIDLLDVPTSSEFRQTVRVFSMRTMQSVATIRIYSQPEADYALVQPAPPPTLLGELEVALAPTPLDPYADPAFPIQPAFARVDHLTAVLPQIQSNERVRVSIQSATPGIPIWGFVTVTNNETQHVTTLTPQFGPN